MEAAVLEHPGFYRSGLFLANWDPFKRDPASGPAFGQRRRRDGSPLWPIAGGAFSASGFYVDNWIDLLDGTQLAIDLSLDSHKWAMYTDTLSPNFSTDTQYSATNEVSGTGYTAGGMVLTGLTPTVTESPAGTLMYDHGDVVWPTADITAAHGAILYADALTNNNLIVAVTFGADFTSTDGDFTIAWAATGVFTLDLTP